MPTNTYEAQRDPCRVGHRALKGTCNILPHLIMSVTLSSCFIVKGLRDKHLILCGCLSHMDELALVKEI